VATSPPPTLVVLAAGIGSRFGGLKQLEAVGPGGATLMDYAVFDAIRAGFGRVVFVVRPETAPAFEAEALPRFRPHVAVATALQRQDDPPGTPVPPSRSTPWGTAHAVLATRDVVTTPFAVVNADDFYGRAAYAAVAAFLHTPAADGAPAYALAGFRLDRTLSPSGPVNRAIARVSAEGWLESVVEVHGLAADGSGGVRGDEDGEPRSYTGGERVSMNCWAFTTALFPPLAAAFGAFLADDSAGTLERREFLIPTVVQGLVRRGSARVRVLPTDGTWTGMTYPADRPLVAATLQDLVARGEYPERLWP